ncbi:MAG: Ig-like domain-containing protein [Nitrospirae bacterium]|nr:Ig-like domain-containing protein [Nitrospirota bacterium]
MQKKMPNRFRFVHVLGFISLLTLTGGSCDQQLKYITLTPESPTISPPGVATAVRSGVVNVSASIGSISGSVPLTVSSATLQSIVIKPETPILPNNVNLQLTAEGHYSDLSIKNISTLVNWSTSDATVSSISPLGVATVAKTGSGTSDISATISGVSGHTLLSLDSSITLNSVTIGTATTLPVGLSRQFSVTASYSDSKLYDITPHVVWSSSNGSFVSIDTGGLATAISPGSSSINAALNGNPLGNSPLFTVTAANLVSVAVSNASNLTTIPGGRSIQYKANGTFSDTSTHDITSQVIWSVDSPTNVFVNNTGLATAIGPANATSTIIATTTPPGFVTPISGNSTLVISPATLQSITVTPLNPTIPVGSTQKFTADANYSDGTNYDVTSLVSWSTGAATNPIATMFTGMVQQFRAMGTYNGGTVDISSLAAWSTSSSSMTSVANIYPSGYALALGPGTAQISATHDGITASTSLSVSPEVALESIMVTPANLNLSVGTRQQYTATGLYHDGSNNNLTPFVTWSSDPIPNTPLAATITATGLVTVIGPSQSKAIISARIGSYTGNTLLTVP